VEWVDGDLAWLGLGGVASQWWEGLEREREKEENT